MTDSEHTSETRQTIAADLMDTVDEAKHRAQAAGERVSRAAQGDAMPPGSRVASNVKETVHSVKAEIDAAKRDARHAGDDKA